MNLKFAGEDCDMLKLLSFPLLELLPIGGELIEQVVDDVGREDLHAQLVSQLLGVALDLSNRNESKHHRPKASFDFRLSCKVRLRNENDHLRDCS